jgi:heterodisulfide reductase subunit A
MLKLAKSPDGFLQEAHPKFKPVDTLVEGVFLAGAVQGPKDIPDTVTQASGAASRAMRLMTPGEFTLDPVAALVREESCDGCGLCVDGCPPGAISISSNRAEINEALCKGCGSCIASCPRGALDLSMYSNEQLLEQVREALAGKAQDEVRILVFADDTCTYRLADSVGTAKLAYATESVITRVPSGSRITPDLMLQAFKAGADGIFIGECEEKSSPFPHSVRAIEQNVSRVRECLEAHGIEPERIRFSQFVTVMLAGFVKQVNGLASYVSGAGPVSGKKRETLPSNLRMQPIGAGNGG